MTRLSRSWAVAALTVGLAAPTAFAAEPDKLLPADTDTVAIVNVKQILDSGIVKKYALEQLKQTLEGQDAKKLLGELGLDPLKDIEKVIVGTSGNNRADVKYLLIVRGKFDAEKIYKTAEAQSKKDGDMFAMIKDGNTVMFKYQPANGDPPVYATVVDDRTIIAASDKKLISNALTADKADKPAQIKAQLATLIRGLDEKASVAVTSMVKGKLDELNLPANLPVDLSGVQKALPNAETVSLNLKIAEDVELAVTFGMKDDESAGDMVKTMDKLLGDLKPLAKLAGAAEPRAKPLTDILGTIKTSSKNKDVTITGKVTGANIGKMINPGD